MERKERIGHGKVYLVGAGPGSSDLITVRGLRLLQQADVLLHDALISPDLVAEASVNAEIFSVGKRGYCIGSTRQETINDAMIRLAREGKSVCRLKCGDPCVFGRGGEEAEILVEAGIPFEIVPGVTSAIGACAAAVIPLTHRDVGQAVALVTGHHDPESPECTLDWHALARLPGLVFYMASRYISRIAAKLCDNGLSPSTPVAIIESGTLEHERIRTGTIADMALSLNPDDVTAPAIFVVGECVRYREKLIGKAGEYTRQELNPPTKTQGFAANSNEEKKRGAESGTPDLFSSFLASLTPDQRGRLLALLMQQA